VHLGKKWVSISRRTANGWLRTIRRSPRLKKREKRIDERIEKLVSAIGDLIRRIPPQNLR
jgi:hypothetical protein